jgi:putative DNA primase/helicase
MNAAHNGIADLVVRCQANPAPLSTWESAFLTDIGKRPKPPTEKQVETLERIAARIDTADLVAALRGRIETLAIELTGKPPSSKGRHEWRFGNRGSLAIIVAGADRGLFKDHETGIGGSPLHMIAHLRQCSPAAAIEWAQEWLGRAPMLSSTRIPSAAASRPAAATTLDFARDIWRAALAPAGTLAEAYLDSRGLALPEDAPLRFHPACPRGEERLPAMVALMTDPMTGEEVGVHRTFLAADGKSKASGQAKMMLGRVGVIRLGPDIEVTAGLGLAEGIETSLAVMQRFGWRPVWAATSAGAISIFPVMAGIEALTIFADADGAGLKAAERCAARWAEDGREARIVAPPSGEDFADTARRVAA